MCVLLDAGAAKVSKNAFETKWVDTPLNYASHKLQVEIVQVLLEQYKADANATGYKENTALVTITSSGRKDEEAAARHKRADIAVLLLEHGANRDEVDKRGYTALFYATVTCPTIIAAVLRDRTIRPKTIY